MWAACTATVVFPMPPFPATMMIGTANRVGSSAASASSCWMASICLARPVKSAMALGSRNGTGATGTAATGSAGGGTSLGARSRLSSAVRMACSSRWSWSLGSMPSSSIMVSLASRYTWSASALRPER